MFSVPIIFITVALMDNLISSVLTKNAKTRCQEIKNLTECSSGHIDFTLEKCIQERWNIKEISEYKKGSFYSYNCINKN